MCIQARKWRKQPLLLNRMFTLFGAKRKLVTGVLLSALNIQTLVLAFVRRTRQRRERVLSSGASCNKQIQLTSYKGAFRREGEKLWWG